MFKRSYINAHKDHPHYITNSKLEGLKKRVNLSYDEEDLLRILKNLSDPTKLKAYLLLHKVEEIPVSDIALLIGVTRSAASHALMDLRNLGLVTSHRCGQLICYSLVRNKRENKLLNFLKILEKY